MKNRFSRFFKSFITFNKGLPDVVNNRGLFMAKCYFLAIVPGGLGIAIVLIKLVPPSILFCFGFERVPILLFGIYIFLIVAVGQYLSRVLVWWFDLLYIFFRKRTSKSELFQVPNKSDFFILGGPGSGCMSTLFCVNGTQWKLPHIEKCSFDDALKYEDNVWRLATLEDFSLLNKCAKYMGGRDKRTINIRIDEFSFYLEPRYWTGNAPQIGQNRADVAVQYYPTGFQPFYEHLPDIDTEKKAGVILVKR